MVDLFDIRLDLFAQVRGKERGVDRAARLKVAAEKTDGVNMHTPQVSNRGDR